MLKKNVTWTKKYDFFVGAKIEIMKFIETIYLINPILYYSSIFLPKKIIIQF